MAGQKLLLLQFALISGSHNAVQYTAINTAVLLITFKEVAGNVFH